MGIIVFLFLLIAFGLAVVGSGLALAWAAILCILFLVFLLIKLIARLLNISEETEHTVKVVVSITLGILIPVFWCVGQWLGVINL